MYALFEEAGKFLTGRVLSQTDSSAQVELDSGKRAKVKATNLLLTFEKPAPAPLMAAVIASICASSSPSASKTTASWLPESGVSVKTSRMA